VRSESLSDQPSDPVSFALHYAGGKSICKGQTKFQCLPVIDTVAFLPQMRDSFENKYLVLMWPIESSCSYSQAAH
jgi:hypothetical protein